LRGRFRGQTSNRPLAQPPSYCYGNINVLTVSLVHGWITKLAYNYSERGNGCISDPSAIALFSDMDKKTQNPLTSLGDKPACNDESSTRVDEAPTVRAQSRTPSSKPPNSTASSLSHRPRPPAASNLRYHLSIEDDLRGVDSRTQSPPQGTKRPRPGSASEEESDDEPKPKRDKLLQELDDLEACSHSEPGLPNKTVERAVNVTSTQSHGRRILSAPDLGPGLRSTGEEERQTEASVSVLPSLHTPKQDASKDFGA
jgi:hypothetical protein